MKKILLFIWQLPQHLLALILKFIWKPVSMEIYKDKKVYRIKQKGIGVSLGNYIFLHTNYSDQTVKHEYGHSIQSIYFGPLYLLFVGIPSAIFNNLWDRLFHKSWSNAKRQIWYYGRWPEGCFTDTKWKKLTADYLGSVKRDPEHLQE